MINVRYIIVVIEPSIDLWFQTSDPETILNIEPMFVPLVDSKLSANHKRVICTFCGIFVYVCVWLIYKQQIKKNNNSLCGWIFIKLVDSRRWRMRLLAWRKRMHFWVCCCCCEWYSTFCIHRCRLLHNNKL